jgi:hypothetical protein
METVKKLKAALEPEKGDELYLERIEPKDEAEVYIFHFQPRPKSK